MFLVVIPGPPALSAGGTGLRSQDCKRERRRRPAGRASGATRPNPCCSSNKPNGFRVAAPWSRRGPRN